MQGGSYELEKTHKKNQRKEGMQRIIYKYNRKKREKNLILKTGRQLPLVWQIRFVVFLAIIRENFVEGNMRILVYQKVSFIHRYTELCLCLIKNCYQNKLPFGNLEKINESDTNDRILHFTFLRQTKKWYYS